MTFCSLFFLKKRRELGVSSFSFSSSVPHTIIIVSLYHLLLHAFMPSCLYAFMRMPRALCPYTCVTVETVDDTVAIAFAIVKKSVFEKKNESGNESVSPSFSHTNITFVLRQWIHPSFPSSKSRNKNNTSFTKPITDRACPHPLPSP